jgi:hypothetical protein
MLSERHVFLTKPMDFPVNDPMCVNTGKSIQAVSFSMLTRFFGS